MVLNPGKRCGIVGTTIFSFVRCRLFFSCLGKKRTKRIPFKGDFLQAVPLKEPPPANLAKRPYQGEDVPIFALLRRCGPCFAGSEGLEGGSLRGGAPRSESKTSMLAGGKHTTKNANSRSEPEFPP